MQPECKRPGQRRFTNDTVEDANRGNADLDGGQKAGGIFTKLDRHLRSTVSILGKTGQAGPPRGDKGNLRHGEEAVQDDQGNKNKDFHGVVNSGQGIGTCAGLPQGIAGKKRRNMQKTRWEPER
ncbi:hypothetical protein SDC9_180889 [bioreactor metagenome]|uniref:Uncharacterized protein n=1 Tax=bioreactor metagenome TaxID=1076179 RepID=A0A645H502_9ZZZZ